MPPKRQLKHKLRRTSAKKAPKRTKLIKLAKKAPMKKIKQEIIGAEELRIERTKFFQPETAPAAGALPQELPGQYNQDRIALQVRDPRWIYAYWEIRNATLERLRNEFGTGFFKAKRILRVYDVTNVTFNGNNFNRYFDIQVGDFANNWYINTEGPGRSWCVDLGLLLASGRFIAILRSNTIQTPLEGPSGETDEEWMVPEEMFARLYGLGFGLGQSSPVGKAWQERAKKALFSGALASSMASPVKKQRK